MNIPFLKKNGKEHIYFCETLDFSQKEQKEFIDQEMKDWAKFRC